MGDETELSIALEWALGDDTGISSKAIMNMMLGRKVDAWTYPSDPADLGRCIRLLLLIPAWRPRIGEMAAVDRVWARLVAAWDKLEACMEAEVGFRWEKAQSAPKTYALMKRICGKY